MLHRKDSGKSAKCSCTVAVGLQECTCASHVPNVHVALWLGVQSVCVFVPCTVCSRYSHVLGVGVVSCVCVQCGK